MTNQQFKANVLIHLALLVAKNPGPSRASAEAVGLSPGERASGSQLGLVGQQDDPCKQWWHRISFRIWVSQITQGWGNHGAPEHQGWG